MPAVEEEAYAPAQAQAPEDAAAQQVRWSPFRLVEFAESVGPRSRLQWMVAWAFTPAFFCIVDGTWSSGGLL